ncbi:MAG: hypothetical protein ACTSWW_05000 [Promethearchaeota archaeon]
MLSFVLFEWAQFDWIAFMPIEVGFLVVLIIIIRILRRNFRWGATQVSHVHSEKITYLDYPMIRYQKIMDPDAQMESEHQNSRLLLVPPLSSDKQKNYHLAQALALLGWDVYQATSGLLNHLTHVNAEDSNSEPGFEVFMKKLAFSAVVVFDYGIDPIFHAMGFADYHHLHNSQVKWILIRPTLEWADINPLWHIIPFSYRWWTKLQMQASKSIKNLSTFKPVNQNIPPETEKITNVYCIEPSRTWLSSEGKQHLKMWQKMFLKHHDRQVFQFSLGGWTFFRNETVVLGLLAQILQKTKKIE